MRPFSFRYGPRVVAGPGASERLTDHLGGARVLLVTDRQLVGLGILAGVIGALRTAGCEILLFDAVEADPSRRTLEAAVALGRDGRATAVLGVGGGSPMDVAKLAAYLLGSGDALDDVWGVDLARGKGLPLVLVPTTAGTGSEATQISIITLDDGEKRGVSAPALTADVAVLDPVLTLGLPRAVTAATGMDAIVHAIEAYTSLHLKNPVSDTLAIQALHLLSANLLMACETPGDVEARGAMMLGSHLAGVAFANAPVAGVHALAYPLGGRFHVPHGLSNALMLPHVLRFNMPEAVGLYAQLGPIFDAGLRDANDQRSANGLVGALVDLTRKSGLPSTLHEVGVGRQHVDGLAADAMRQERLLRNNPRPITEPDARRLYEEAL